MRDRGDRFYDAVFPYLVGEAREDAYFVASMLRDPQPDDDLFGWLGIIADHVRAARGIHAPDR